MIYETVKIKVDYKKAGLSYEGLEPTLTAFAPDISDEFSPPPQSALLILPGGGYEYCSDREADPVALHFAGQGIACFVLRYSCVNKRFPTALLEAMSAMKYIKDNAERYSIDKNRVSVIGFSAGGHLAGCLSNFYFDKKMLDVIGADEADVKPQKSLLCYPVITSGEYAHEGSILNIINGAENPDELRKKLSLENAVSKKTPETFLWHTADDGCVPIENSLLYMSALSKAKIPFEAHIYEWGGHGMSVCDKTVMSDPNFSVPVNAEWVKAAGDFIKR